MKKERLNKNFLEEFKNYNFSKIKEKNIYLVGSSQFKDYFIKIESILQIIYQKQIYVCSVDGLLNKNLFSEDEWEKLQTIALQKLHNHDAILILDVNQYIGSHSREEIEYFKKVIKKPIYYLSQLTN